MTITNPVIMTGENMLMANAAIVSSVSLQSFAKLNDLKESSKGYYPIATMEPNYWLLDGNYKLKPDDAGYHSGVVWPRCRTALACLPLSRRSQSRSQRSNQ